MFSVNRPEKFGEPMYYAKYEDLERCFAEQVIHLGDLKGVVSDALVKLSTPIQELYAHNKAWQEVTELAYPDSSMEEGKNKVRFGLFFSRRSWRVFAKCLLIVLLSFRR